MDWVFFQNNSESAFEEFNVAFRGSLLTLFEAARLATQGAIDSFLKSE